MNRFLAKKLIAAMSIVALIFVCTSCGAANGKSGASNTDTPDFDSSFNCALKSSVKVESGTLSGSGNIWKIGKKTITVVTASHVIDDKEDIKVYFWNGDHAGAQVFTNNSEKDYCLLTVKVDDTKDLDLGAVSPSKSLPETGESIFMVIPDYNTASAGLVAGPEVYSEDFSQNLIYCYVDVNEGMSGGGLFNNHGKYLGLLLGGSDEGEGVFLPSSHIN